jgi:aminopeptidase YwaD
VRLVAAFGVLVCLHVSLNGYAQQDEQQEFATERARYVTRATATIATLAGDSLAGRGYGPADGARRAAHYLAKRFRALGLEPFGDSVGRSYFQHFPLPVNTFHGKLALALNKRPLRPGLDFIAAPECPSVRVGGKICVFDTTWYGLDSVTLAKRLRPRSLRGQILVLRARDEKRLAKLPIMVRRWVETASAVLVRHPKLTASVAQEQARQPWLYILDSAWARQPHPPVKGEIRVDARFEPAYPAMNVVGRMRGTGQSDSVLLVTAHYDHLGQQGSQVTFYGANDNAAGSAMLLELANHFREHPPRHDLMFIAFSAEEAGLVGSQWYTKHPAVPLSRSRFLLNLDLEGFGDKGITVVNATIHPRAFALLRQLNDSAGLVAGQPLLPVVKPRGRAANSDHFPFSALGVPAFFGYSLGGPGYYHDVRDRPATLHLTDAYAIFRLFSRFLTALDAQI